MTYEVFTEDTPVFNATLMDPWEGRIFVGAFTDSKGRRLVALGAGADGSYSVAKLDAHDVQQLRAALDKACAVHQEMPEGDHL